MNRNICWLLAETKSLKCQKVSLSALMLGSTGKWPWRTPAPSWQSLHSRPSWPWLSSCKSIGLSWCHWISRAPPDASSLRTRRARWRLGRRTWESIQGPPELLRQAEAHLWDLKALASTVAWTPCTYEQMSMPFSHLFPKSPLETVDTWGASVSSLPLPASIWNLGQLENW
jgi:hypothetical protein